MGKKNLWIQDVVKPSEKGLLHKQLGIPESQTIPKSLIQRIVKTPVGGTVKADGQVKVTRLLKQRAQFALNVGYGRYQGKKKR